jgi:asparagine synthase (glutamine-hydrolysing)
MGGFLLIRKNGKTRLEEIEESYKESIVVFHKKGLKLARKIVRKHLIIFHYHKHFGSEENIYEFGHDDFILSFGTFLYKDKTGPYALQALFEDFLNNNIIHYELCGHYAIVISVRSHVYCFNDYLGLYRVYFDTDQKAFSNSFLAVSKTVKEKTVASQELYEYVFHEAFFGGKTVFKEIELLDSKSIWKILPEIQETPKKLVPLLQPHSKNITEIVQAFAETQIEYFTMLKNNYGDNITSGLSGGYDTRLMLALMRKVGISPNLYVYGDDTARDVEIAKTIAKGEGLKLEHINKSNYPNVELHDFHEILSRNFYGFDGLGNTGIFDNGSDLDTRMQRAKGAAVQLNGVGGEIYRNNGKLPDQEITVQSFIRSKYRLPDYSMRTHPLEKDLFYSNLEEKLKATLSIDGERMTRQQVEMHFPFFLYKYCSSINSSINNQFSYSLTPFTEARFVYPSFIIPLRNKNFGVFHCSLIQCIDPNLTKYPFTKGFDFLNKINVSEKERIDELFLKAYYSIKASNSSPIKSPENRHPYFLQEEYLREIFGNTKNLFINRFLKLNQINNPKILSRALSIECLIQDKFQ